MLCDFAQAFPAFVAGMLEREDHLKRSFREETLTDMWVASLVPLKKYGVHVDLAVESETGGDLEIWFLSKQLDKALAFVIQAKRIHCRRSSPRPGPCITKSWKTHSFAHLDHPGGKGRSKGGQAHDLVKASKDAGRNLYPLYAFYAPQHVCDTSRQAVQGVMLADGFEVCRRIVTGLRNRKRFKQIKALQDLFIPLSAMFCVNSWTKLSAEINASDFANQYVLFKLAASGVDILNIPGPEDIQRSMSDALGKTSKFERTISPVLTENIPADIRALVSGEPRWGEDRWHVQNRSRIVFVASK
jgi:hypothetical protein